MSTEYSSNKLNLYTYGSVKTTNFNLVQNVYNQKLFNLSGVEIDQSQYSSSVVGTDGATQQFAFTSDYLRANKYTPSITGFQIFAEINHALTPELTYYISRYDDVLKKWVALTHGKQAVTKLTSGVIKNQWITIKPYHIDFDPNWIGRNFKLQVFGNSGVTKIYYQSSFTLTDTIKDGFKLDGTTKLNGALTFRVLTSSADTGIDFLGNKYRSGVFKAHASNVLSTDNTSTWFSKPNPSKFAVENLYFDLSINDQPVEIDSVLLDPLTPNIYFNVYYSNDSVGPETNDETWEKLLWTRVPKVFKAIKKQSYVLPDTISAKYVKIEFTHLQGKYYAPGDFEKPILYKKFPQWVLDYFIAEYEYKRNKTYDPFIKGQITLEYDLLDLAFNYYKGDIIDGVEIPPSPTNDPQSNNALINLLNANYDQLAGAGDLNIDTLSSIKIAFSKFSSHPATSGNSNSTVGALANQNAYSTLGAGLINGRIAPAQNYPTEIQTPALADTTQVSTFDREPLLFEKSAPSMFFFVNCRHEYREAYAKFSNDKAYFAGIKQIAFQKASPVAVSDDEIYTYKVNGTSANLEHNDFIMSDDKKSWLAR
jgi:hypothetical protein